MLKIGSPPGAEELRAEGYRCGVIVHTRAGSIEIGTIEATIAILERWMRQRGLLIAFRTVEAGAMPEFLRDPWIDGYLEIKAKLALLLQRKIDARKIEAEIRRRIYQQ